MPDVSRKPTAYALKGFLAVALFPTAVGLVPLPGSLAEGPDIFGQTAAILWWLGAMVSLVGLSWRGKDRLDGLVIEQVGLCGVALGCFLYAAALTGVENFGNALIAFGMCIGIGAASIVQWWSIRNYRRAKMHPADPYDDHGHDHGDGIVDGVEGGDHGR